MDLLEKKFPKGAASFYINLYCRRKNDTEIKSDNVHREAMKSWISLSKAEKQVFENKYNEYTSNFKKRIAGHLKNVEPYLKPKVLKPINRNDSSHNASQEETQGNIEMCQTSFSKIEIEDDMDNMDGVIDHNNSEINQNNESDVQNFNQNDNMDGIIDHNSSEINQNNESDVQNFNQNDNDGSPLYTSQLQADVIPIPEPTPPQTITAKELFLIKEKELNDIEWTNLSPIEKKRYQHAVLAIKKKYLIEYRTYLEHLSSEKLFKYYRNIISSEPNS